MTTRQYIMIIAFIQLPSVMDAHATSFRKSEKMQAEVEVQSIAMAAKAFSMEYGVYPLNNTWYTELATPSNAVVNVHHILFLEMPDGASDPWGQTYNYRSPGVNKTNGVDVWSNGRDGKSATSGNDPDDINNWNSSAPWRTQYSSSCGLMQYGGQICLSAFLILAVTVLFRIYIRNKRKPEPSA